MRALLEKLYAVLPAGDQEALAQLVAPDFIGRTTPGMPMGIGGEHRGRDEMWLEIWSVIGRNFDARAVTQEWVSCARARMLVTGRYMGSSRKNVIESQFSWTDAEFWDRQDEIVAPVFDSEDAKEGS